MGEYGVRCTMGDGQDTVITVDATDADDAARQVRNHKALFYGNGDGAGAALAAARPTTTITAVHEAKPIGEWV